MKVLIDLDDTVANWGDAYDTKLDDMQNYAYDDDIRLGAKTVPRFADLTSYDLFSGRSPLERKAIQAAMDSEDFYAGLRPIDGAIDAVTSMVDWGWDVWFVSTPWPSNATCASDKLNWVKDFFGEELSQKVILTFDKTMIDGDVLIDDKPVIAGARKPTWRHVLYAQPHNLIERAKRKERGILNWTDGEWKDELLRIDSRIEYEQLQDRENKLLTNVKGEIRSTSSTGGQKGVKPQNHALVPTYPLGLLAELYDFGAQKYEDHNWRKGYEWSKSYSAAQRHLQAFWSGEDYDWESGLPHVTSAAFHVFALAQFMKDHPDFDDRYKEAENV